MAQIVTHREKYKVLLLHTLGDPAKRRASLEKNELLFLDLKKQIPCEVIEFDAYLPLPSALEKINFDAIIITASLASIRYGKKRLESFKKTYNFIKHSSAFKILFAQDDYNFYQVLDKWMCDWRIDLLYNVIHGQEQNLFPNFIKSGGEVVKGFTQYITSDYIANLHSLKLNNPLIDVGYRAKSKMSTVNELALLKATIDKSFLTQFSQYPLRMDISTNEADAIAGEDWYQFIANCKFTITTNSGSSILVPDHSFNQRLEKLVKRFGVSNLDSIRKSLYGDSKKTYYSAISPRNIEAALLYSCQLGTTLGNYSNLMIPDIHFIPLEQDCNNHHEVYLKMQDKPYVEKLKSNCLESILSCKDLRAENLLSSLSDKIKDHKTPSIISHQEQKYMEEVKEHKIKKAKLHYFLLNTRKQLYNLKRNYFLNKI